jgi:hypothetical protein
MDEATGALVDGNARHQHRFSEGFSEGPEDRGRMVVVSGWLLVLFDLFGDLRLPWFWSSPHRRGKELDVEAANQQSNAVAFRSPTGYVCRWPGGDDELRGIPYFGNRGLPTRRLNGSRRRALVRLCRARLTNWSHRRPIRKLLIAAVSRR